MRQILQRLKFVKGLHVSVQYLFAVLPLALQVSPVQAETYYFHNDHLGTPQAVTDTNQEVVWKGEYDPFGKVTETVALVVQNLRFPGQYFDEETGLHYNYFRTYDPCTGRYLESDPIGLIGGLSTFGYTYQNPVRYYDPTGEIVPIFLLAMATRAALGATSSFMFNAGTQAFSNGVECVDWTKALVAAGTGGVIAAIAPMGSFSPGNLKKLRTLSKIAERNSPHSKAGKLAREKLGDYSLSAAAGTALSLNSAIVYDYGKRHGMIGATRDSCDKDDNGC